MTRTTKGLLIALIAFMLTAAGVYSWIYLDASKKSANEVTPTKQPVKSADEKEMDSLSTEIKNSEDLDLTELDGISNELDKIDLNGL